MTPPRTTWTCQALSLLAHLALAFLGSALLGQPARFGMETVPPILANQTPSTLFAEVQAEPRPPDPEPNALLEIPRTEADPKKIEHPIHPKPEPKRPHTSPKTLSSPSTHVGPGSPGPGTSGARTISRADYLRNPPPAYPPESRRRREQGTVTLLVDVAPDGRPRNIHLRSSSGYPALDSAARSAVARWRFQPASIGGIHVASQVIVPIRFELDALP